MKSDTFYNSKESAVSIILEKEGIRLKEGLNLISTLEGSFSLSGKINLQYQLRNYFNQEENKLSVHRAFVTFNFEKLFLFIGKDNIKVGPSRYGNLLSSTNPPFYQARIQSKRPLEFFGLLDFTVMYGKFLEDRKDHSDPSLFFIRGDYKPNRYLEIGINRAVLFGGEGRSSYRIKEYPRVFIGREETLGGRFDNDSYLGYDVRLNLFFDKLDIFQVYYENNATDIESPLKKGDPKKLHFPLVLFKFHDNAQTLGVKVKRGRYLLNWELTNTGKTMYINHNYPVEGLSYKSFVLGYPYGRSVTHTFLLLSILDKEVDNHLEVGFIKQPTDITLPDRFKDYYITYRINLKRGKFEISPYIRVDFTENLNYSTLPTQFYIKQGSTTIYTGGMSIGYLF
ncbi:MAG: capsule assembly Wzi family protein [Hydrogenothermaceae bacterium]|nr:capsule assembly Wzi family protein [Hydrogenothermaceae bacterium]